MRTITSWAFFGLVATCFCHVNARAALDEVIPLSVVGKSVVLPNGGFQCFIAISNQSEIDSLQNVNVSIFNEGVSRIKIGPINLAPMQSITSIRPASESTWCSGREGFIQVSYHRHGIPNQTILPIPESAQVPNTALMGAVVGGLIGIISGLTAAGLTHRLAESRERSKARRERFSRLEPLFNTFFVNWNRSPTPAELQKRFDELQRQVTFDQTIIDAYRTTYRILANNGGSPDEQNDACATFENLIRQHLAEANPDVRRFTWRK